MAVIKFPETKFADQNGLLALGGDLEVETLMLAYSQGIFPWPISEDFPLAWFAPKKRCILYVDDLRFSEGFQRFQKKTKFQIKTNTNFLEVIETCATIRRKKQKGTWITDEIIDGYLTLHKAGYAHSIECYQESDLVGGLYGVGIGQMFAAESMFHSKPYAGQLCLKYLAKHLHDHGAKWFDCQITNHHLKKLGAKEVSREQFESLLKEAISKKQISFE